MKIAKKNILSSLKAMKGRLFGTRQKPQSESEKNLQSIAREEKSQYSKQQPEIKAKSPGESVPTDAELLEMSRRFSGIGVSATEAINAMASLVRAAAHEADELIETRIRPNNWLKLHGYPMRRKGKGRKRK